MEVDYITLTAVQRLHQPGQNSILVAPVAALRDADIVFVLGGKLRDQLPGGIPRAVVDEQHPALVADQPGPCQVGDLLQEHRGGDGQHLLLVIAGDNDPEDRF